MQSTPGSPRKRATTAITPSKHQFSRDGSGGVELGSVWVANAAELAGFNVTRRTTHLREPLFHGL